MTILSGFPNRFDIMEIIHQHPDLFSDVPTRTNVHHHDIDIDVGVAAPLTNLLSPKVLFVWSSLCQSAFENLKALLDEKLQPPANAVEFIFAGI